jgi:2'-5' RNA ligase
VKAPAELARLMKRLTADAEGYTGRADPRKRNRAHLTITRNANQPEIEQAMAALSVYSGPSWQVDEIHLVESQLGKGPGGHPLYRPLLAAQLGYGSTKD